jgi:hypothetical protein
MSKFDEGRYRGKIVKWELSESKKKQTPQIAFTFAVIGYYTPSRELMALPGSDERTVFKFFTEKTIDYVLEDLRRLGWDGADPAELSPTHPNAFDFAGKECDLTCEYEEYEGKQRERWNMGLGGGGLELTPLDKKGVAALTARFGDKFKATSAKKTPSRPPAPQAAAPVAAEADETL